VTSTFTDAARHCCALSARLLGWRPPDFWRATPAELLMALADPARPDAVTPPSPETITRMMERDANG
jgi:Phage tail assembly chaperone protein, TAC